MLEIMRQREHGALYLNTFWMRGLDISCRGSFQIWNFPSSNFVEEFHWVFFHPGIIFEIRVITIMKVNFQLKASVK